MSQYTQDELNYIAAQITRLIVSTEALHERFGTAQGPFQAWRIMYEEMNEVLTAHRDGDTEHTKHELIDVLVTYIGLCRACGFDIDEVLRHAEAVAQKNDSKTQESHVVTSDGKIRRRAR